MHRELLAMIIEFDWDEGNYFKSLRKHDVSAQEAEEVFINAPLIISNDGTHSVTEKRYAVYGRTHEDRKLFAVFTLRNRKVRIISVRPMDKKERKIYDQEEA